MVEIRRRINIKQIVARTVAKIDRRSKADRTTADSSEAAKTATTTSIAATNATRTTRDLKGTNREELKTGAITISRAGVVSPTATKTGTTIETGNARHRPRIRRETIGRTMIAGTTGTGSRFRIERQVGTIGTGFGMTIETIEVGRESIGTDAEITRTTIGIDPTTMTGEISSLASA